MPAVAFGVMGVGELLSSVGFVFAVSVNAAKRESKDSGSIYESHQETIISAVFSDVCLWKYFHNYQTNYFNVHMLLVPTGESPQPLAPTPPLSSINGLLINSFFIL